MIKNFKQINDYLYRGSAPNKYDLKILFDNFGIRKVVSLDDLIANKIYPYVNDLGMEHVVIPLTGCEDSNTKNISYLLKNINNIMDNEIPTYIHCRHGSDRTGLAVALFRVLNDAWDPASAIDEAKEYQFGQRISDDTEKFYSDLISGNTDCSDVEDNDIVQTMRDWFEMGAAAPAFPPQQTFAPEIDIEFATKNKAFENVPTDTYDNISPAYKDHSYFSTNNKYPSTPAKRRMELRKLIMDGIAQVGNYDNYEGIRGVGLGKETGGYSYPDEGEGVPGGAGIVETGGFLNL